MRRLHRAFPIRMMTIIPAAILVACSRPEPPVATDQRGRGIPPELQIAMLHVGINDQIKERGLLGALPAYADSTTWLLWPALPAMRGVGLIQAFLSQQPGIDSVRMLFDPLRIVVSPDTSLALFYGAAVWDNRATRGFKVGRYLMAWRRDAGRWWLAAGALVNLIDPREVRSDSAAPPAQPVLDSLGPAGPFIAADEAFAAEAGRVGAANAFAKWAAEDAVTFASTGPLQRGPEAIAAALRRLDGSSWRWHPVGAGASADSTLGWTAGEATITVPDANGGTRELHSKYLTLWQRQPDGSIKFIADGGNERP